MEQVAKLPVDAVLCGDAVTLIRELPDASVDMVFMDPPYGHTENGSLQQRREAVFGWSDGKGVYRDGEGAYSPLVANDGAEADEVLAAILPEIKRVLVPGGCCCCGGGGGGPDPQFARWSLMIDQVLNFKMAVVWDKGPMGMGWHYRRSYEMVLVSQKGQKCNWYDESHRVENVIRHIGKILPSKDQHPTEKPIELAQHFIRLHSQPGDLILDPFAGSGSTGVAARKEGRRFLGFEIDPKWHEAAAKRVAEAVEEPGLFVGVAT